MRETADNYISLRNLYQTLLDILLGELVTVVHNGIIAVLLRIFRRSDFLFIKTL
jgi:hypothetical protein